MDEFVRFFTEYEVWVYVILGLFALFQVRKFVLAWDELREAAFGMERESAQSRLNQAATLLALALFMVVAEFMLVSFIAPSTPGAFPIPSPTLDLLATATAVLPGNMLGLPQATLEATATLEPVQGQGCTPRQVVITLPKDGSQVSGVVSIQGTADIPNFGFYKYEVARPGETVWLSINAGNNPVKDNVLGEWNTTVLPPGEYLLRLIVTDNQGRSMSPCLITVRVVEPPP